MLYFKQDSHLPSSWMDGSLATLLFEQQQQQGKRLISRSGCATPELQRQTLVSKLVDQHCL